MPEISIPRGTVENIHATVTADVTLTDAMAVAIAIGRARAGDVDTYTWLTAAWAGDEATTRTAVTSDPVSLTRAAYPEVRYKVYVKVDDTTEAPIIEAGEIVLT